MREKPVIEWPNDITLLKNQCQLLQDVLWERTVQLDALGFVWCNCEDGVFRFNEQTLTESDMLMIEDNTRRLRKWFDQFGQTADQTIDNPLDDD